MAKGNTVFSNNADEHELLEVKKEILRLKSQLKQTEEERDILKKAARYFSISLSLNTAINLKLKRCFGFLRLLVLAITPGCMNPNQAKRLKISGYDSSSVLLMMPVMVSMGYRRITLDLKELGESCGPNRVLKIMMNNSIAAVRGYKKHKSYGRGRPQIVPSNHLNREFVVKTPDILRNSVSQVTDITYIRTWQGWLYLAVVLDLYSRKVIGWSMKPTLAKDIVLDALLMAVWRRKPNESMIIHSIARYTAHGIMPLLNPFLAI